MLVGLTVSGESCKRGCVVCVRKEPGSRSEAPAGRREAAIREAAIRALPVERGGLKN